MAFYDGLGDVFSGDIDLFGFGGKRRGYQQAQQDSRALGDKIQAFEMQGLNKALGFYEPALAMNQAIYGTPNALRK